MEKLIILAIVFYIDTKLGFTDWLWRQTKDFFRYLYLRDKWAKERAILREQWKAEAERKS